MRIFSKFILNLFIIWPFKLIRWIFGKIFKRRDEEEYYFEDEEEATVLDGALDRAVVFATEYHEGQYRKEGQTPYILHPLETAAIASTMTDDEDILAAAVLHEAAGNTEDIIEAFGSKVAYLVRAQDAENRAFLETQPLSVKMLVLSDELSNVRALNVCGAVKDKSPRRRYYKQVAFSLSELCEYPAYKEFTELIDKIFGNEKVLF